MLSRLLEKWTEKFFELYDAGANVRRDPREVLRFSLDRRLEGSEQTKRVRLSSLTYLFDFVLKVLTH